MPKHKAIYALVRNRLRNQARDLTLALQAKQRVRDGGQAAQRRVPKELVNRRAALGANLRTAALRAADLHAVAADRRAVAMAVVRVARSPRAESIALDGRDNEASTIDEARALTRTGLS